MTEMLIDPAEQQGGAGATLTGPGGASALVEQVVQHIDRLIRRGDLEPGDVVSEAALCNDLGIGRVPVREAIRILVGENLLELFPNRSARVRRVAAREILEMLNVLTGFSVSALQRFINSPFPENALGELRERADRIRQLGECNASAEALMREISLFSYRLIEASENEYLLKLLRKTRIHYYSRYLIALLGQRAFIEAAPNYEKIVRALERNDSLEAIRIILKSAARSRSHAGNF